MITNKIVNEAIEFILLNIGENITLEQVAANANMSVSHFSKLFKEETNSSVYSFIKKIKLEQSAMKIKMENDRSITDIGADYGYSSSNYSSAFSLYHKKSPSAFRDTVQAKMQNILSENENLFNEINSKITIQKKPDVLVMYERSIGNYSELKEAWCNFMKKYDEYKDTAIFFERTFDDPTICDKDKCIFDICMSISGQDKHKFSNTCVLAGGKFAVYSFKGYMKDIYPINQQIIGVWFPQSHYEIDDRYAYDQYYLVNDDGYMEFDICIPIK